MKPAGYLIWYSINHVFEPRRCIGVHTLADAYHFIKSIDAITTLKDSGRLITFRIEVVK